MKTGLIISAIGLVAAASIGVSANPQSAAGPKGPALQAGAPAGPKGPSLQEPDPALVQKYCLTCHSARVKTGGLSLEGLSPAEAAAHADVWEKVVMKLRGGMMPPQGMPRPDEPTLEAFAVRARADAGPRCARHGQAGLQARASSQPYRVRQRRARSPRRAGGRQRSLARRR
jgi:cytochrome c551/c552